MARTPRGETALAKLLSGLLEKVDPQRHQTPSVGPIRFPLSRLVLMRLLEAGGSLLIESKRLQPNDQHDSCPTVFHSLLRCSGYTGKVCLSQALELVSPVRQQSSTVYHESVPGRGQPLHVSLRNANQLPQAALIQIIEDGGDVPLLHTYEPRVESHHNHFGFGGQHRPETDTHGQRSALHVALLNADNISDCVFDALLEKCGADQLNIKTRQTNQEQSSEVSALMLAFNTANKMRPRLLSSLLGCCTNDKDVLYSIDQSGNTVLHAALRNHTNIPSAAFKQLIELGGYKLVSTAKNDTRGAGAFGPPLHTSAVSELSGTPFWMALKDIGIEAPSHDVIMTDATGDAPLSAVQTKEGSLHAQKLGTAIAHMIDVAGVGLFLPSKSWPDLSALIADRERHSKTPLNGLDVYECLLLLLQHMGEKDAAGGKQKTPEEGAVGRKTPDAAAEGEPRKQMLIHAAVAAATHGLVLALEHAQFLPLTAIPKLLELHRMLHLLLNPKPQSAAPSDDGGPTPTSENANERSQPHITLAAALNAAEFLSDDLLAQILSDMCDDAPVPQAGKPLIQIALENAEHIAEQNMLTLIDCLTSGSENGANGLCDMGWDGETTAAKSGVCPRICARICDTRAWPKASTRPPCSLISRLVILLLVYVGIIMKDLSIEGEQNPPGFVC